MSKYLWKKYHHSSWKKEEEKSHGEKWEPIIRNVSDNLRSISLFRKWFLRLEAEAVIFLQKSSSSLLIEASTTHSRG